MKSAHHTLPFLVSIVVTGLALPTAFGAEPDPAKWEATYEGTWTNFRTVSILIHKVAAGKAEVTYVAGRSSMAVRPLSTDTYQLEGTFTNEKTLVAKFPRGSTLTLALIDDGTLAGKWADAQGGGLLYATFKKK